MSLTKELEKITSDFNIFVTNQGNNTLENKLKNILNREYIKYVDILVAFFRMSGFNIISELLQKKEKVRVLIGINTEKEIVDSTQLIEHFLKGFIEDLQAEIYKKKDDNVKLLLSLLKDKKIEIKAVENNDNHSKLYIFRNDNYEDLQGSVIIGSSNLSENGLRKNFEINTILNKDIEIDEATKIFNILWGNAQPLSEKDIQEKIIKKLKNFTYEAKKQINYPEIFYKILIEYFDAIIENNLDFSDFGFELFNYQKDAVNSALFKLNKYNGVILGDVVGLGKTVIAISILKQLNQKTLIIAPPPTHNQWEDTLKKFKFDNYELVSFKTLPEIFDGKVVIVDESHKLRNDKATRYKQIQNLCKTPFRKKVILLTATLQNNSPEDIANQIYLFQDPNNSNIPNIVSLQNFFSPLINDYKSLKKIEDKQKVKETLQNISTKIKNEVLKHIIIRRTRTDIESYDMYKKDIEKFPTVEDKIWLEYKLDKKTKEKFDITIDYLTNKLQFHRFRVLNELNEDGKNKYKKNNPHLSDNIFEDNDLSTLARFQLIKRFDSSYEAFKISLKRSIVALTYFIDALKKDRLYVGKDSNKVLEATSKNEYIYDGERVYYIKKTKNKEEKIWLKGTVFKKSDFKNPAEYIKNLETELIYLQELKQIWDEKINDTKLQKLNSELKKQKNKIIIFTEFTDTLNYLQRNLDAKIKAKTLFITSQNREELIEDIAQNFDANYEPQSDIYQFLITTDTLAEGVNLHRSNTIINYDLPWNSTKLMQRIGRVNRIGTKFDTINVYNFKPTNESEDILGLLSKSYIKLQSFHFTLGEDSKILFDEEDVSSFGLNEDNDEELQYLQIIRDLKKNDTKLFEKIKHFISDLYVQMQGEKNKEMAFFKIDDIAYFYEKEENEYKNISFVEFIKCVENAKKSKVLENNSKIDEVIEYHYKNIRKSDIEKRYLNKTSKKQKEAIGIIKEWTKSKIISIKLSKNIIKLINSKAISNLPDKIIQLKNKNKSEIENILKLYDIQNIEILAQADIKTKIFISIEEN